MPLAKCRKAVARASSAARGRAPARHDHHDPGPPSLSSCGGAGASPPPSCPRVATLTSASGNFCPSQKTARAFGVTECVQMRQGDRLARGQAPHAAILVSAFCILTTINAW